MHAAMRLQIATAVTSPVTVISPRASTRVPSISQPEKRSPGESSGGSKMYPPSSV